MNKDFERLKQECFQLFKILMASSLGATRQIQTIGL